MTKWTAAIVAATLAVGWSGAASAGGGHGKCTEGTDQASLAKRVEKMKAHGWLGLETDKNAQGAYVVKSVVAGSPAAAAGFQAGDVLVALNGVALAESNMEAVKKAKAGNAPGKEVTYTIRRGGAERQVTATLAPVPREVLAQWLGEHLIDEHLGTAVAAND